MMKSSSSKNLIYLIRILLSLFIGIVFWKIVRDWDYVQNYLLENSLIVHLTNVLSQVTTFFIDLTGYKYTAFKNFITIQNTRGMEIIYGCLGISHLVLMFFLIISYSGNIWVKSLFASISLLTVVLMNSVRLSGIALVMVRYPELGEWGHYYFTRVIIYSGIIFLWMYYVNVFSKIKLNKHVYG